MSFQARAHIELEVSVAMRRRLAAMGSRYRMSPAGLLRELIERTDLDPPEISLEDIERAKRAPAAADSIEFSISKKCQDRIALIAEGLNVSVESYLRATIQEAIDADASYELDRARHSYRRWRFADPAILAGALLTMGAAGGSLRYVPTGLEETGQVSLAQNDPVFVHPGRFISGCDPELDGDCRSLHTVATRRTEGHAGFFAIDRTEVTVLEFRQCIEAGACWWQRLGDSDCNGSLGDEGWMKPMNCIRWNDAERYCKWRGGRLPTDLEWEKASRGTDGRRHSWGNSEPTCTVRHDPERCGGVPTEIVGTRIGGRSPYGAEDMDGNAWEWTSTPGPMIVGKNTDMFFIRNGPIERARRHRNNASPEIGFRCVYDQVTVEPY